MAGDINRAAVLMTLNASSNPRSGIKDWEGKGGADYRRRTEEKKKNMSDMFAWDTVEGKRTDAEECVGYYMIEGREGGG